jgi:hypothetical protein
VVDPGRRRVLCLAGRGNLDDVFHQGCCKTISSEHRPWTQSAKRTIVLLVLLGSLASSCRGAHLVDDRLKLGSLFGLDAERDGVVGSFECED